MAPCEEGGHRHLVGGVQHRGACRPAPRSASQASCRPGKRRASAGSKLSAASVAKSSRAAPDSMRSRIRQAVGDRHAHVGRAELRQHRAVAADDHRMDDALRMDHDADLLGLQVEQPARLDHLERLVHHRRRIDRDLAAHHPVRVGAGLVGRHVGQRRRVARAERPARGGQHDVVDARRPGRAVFGQALEDRRVLAVDRQQRRAALAHRLHEQRAADDQRLLVGEQQALAGARRGEARRAGRRRRRWPPSPRRRRGCGGEFAQRRRRRRAPRWRCRLRRKPVAQLAAPRRGRAARRSAACKRRHCASSSSTRLCARQRERPRSARGGARRRPAC